MYISSFISKLTLALLVFLTASTLVHAATVENEIHYAYIDSISNDSVTMTYKGPSGQSHFSCDLDDYSCKNIEAKTTVSAYISTSKDGAYGVKAITVPQGSSNINYYSVYKLTGDTPLFVSLIPFYNPIEKVYWSANSQYVFFRDQNSVLYRFTIRTNELTKIDFGQSTVPFLSISEDGNHVALYNYALGVKIWNALDNSITTVPNQDDSYTVFSKDGTTAFFLTNTNGFENLSKVNLTTEDKIVTSLDPGKYTVEDYVVAGNSLYYMANKSDPLNWTLYRYVISTGEISTIDENISYGDYLYSAQGKIFYLKVNGKNSNVNIYNPDTDTHTELTPLPDSPVRNDITREEKVINGLYTVVLQSSNQKSNKPLFIWLHGGPQRQTTLGYHSYLSYAVYDELLETIAAGGSTVVKVNYSGSFGFGNNFLSRLKDTVGVQDEKDIAGVIQTLTNEGSYSKVYLIGNSYGGYLALQTLAEDSQNVDGAISINGVTDWYGLITTIPSSPFNKLFGGTPDLDNYSKYIDASIYNKLNDIDNQKILIVNGELDDEVPTNQSTHFYEYAKDKGKNINLLSLPNEGHIITERNDLTSICNKIADDFSLHLKCSVK